MSRTLSRLTLASALLICGLLAAGCGARELPRYHTEAELNAAVRAQLKADHTRSYTRTSTGGPAEQATVQEGAFRYAEAGASASFTTRVTGGETPDGVTTILMLPEAAYQMESKPDEIPLAKPWLRFEPGTPGDQLAQLIRTGDPGETPAGSPPSVVRDDTRYRDWGQPVRIEAPPADQVGSR